MALLHSAAATRRAVIIAVIVGLLAIPIVVGLLWWLSTPSNANAPVDCVPAATWSAWSDCSAPCGGGWQYQTRPPSVMPANGGAECGASDLVASQSCNTDVPCGLPCIPNPDGDQYAWSGCPACLPAGSSQALQWRIVPPLQEPGPYGTPCPDGSVFQTSLCVDVPLCPADIDCTISTTTVVASTSCNTPCGPGVQVLWHSISQLPSGAGAGCDWNLYVEQVPCTNGPCPATTSCDASQETWSAWSPCDVTCGTGWQYATRVPNGPLDLCPMVKSQTCAGLLPPCAGTATAGCCVLGPDCAAPTWDYLEALCYMQCAGMPLPTAAPSDNGVPFCSVTQDMLNAACGAGAVPGQGACLEPRDCSVSSWSPWSDCSVGGCDAEWEQGGVQVSYRTIAAYAVGGGIPCSAFPTVAYQPCNNIQAVQYMSVSAAGLVPATAPPQCVPVNCTLSAWAPVGPCSAACGTGWQMMAASITTPPSGGGSCDISPSDFVTSQTCDSGVPCGGCVFMTLPDYLAQSAEDGQNPWSTCSAECDGLQTLTLPLIASASAGGWCSYSDAVVTQPCCAGCVCADACPMGANGEPCSQNGVCGSATSGGTWSYSCTCADGFSGAACGVMCPSGPTGLVCNGMGTCGGDGVCTCSAGLSGEACEQGGWCAVYLTGYVYPFTTCSAINPGSAMGQVYGLHGAIQLDSNFTQDHCLMLSALPSTLTSFTMNTCAPGLNVPGNTCSGVAQFSLLGAVETTQPANVTQSCGLDNSLADYVTTQWPAGLAAQFGTPTLTSAAWWSRAPYTPVLYTLSCAPNVCSTLDAVNVHYSIY